jgi:ribosomal protein L37AE/L43A
MKKISGKFSSFQDLGAALGIKPAKGKKEKPRKCPKCGKELRKLEGTNIYVCDYSTLEDKVLKDGTTAQVSTKCGTVIFA